MEQALPASALLETLRHILTPGFRDAYHPTILVDDQIPIFYDPGTPPGRQRPVAIPDCTIALDVDTRAAHARWGYDPIQLGKPPDVVIEFASRSTYRNDLTTKRDIYRDLKILEYWRFDATGGLRYGRPLTGDRLEGGEYRQLPTLRYGHGIVGATSIVLDLNFRWNGRRFTIHNPRTGVEYLHPRMKSFSCRKRTGTCPLKTAMCARKISACRRKLDACGGKGRRRPGKWKIAPPGKNGPATALAAHSALDAGDALGRAL